MNNTLPLRCLRLAGFGLALASALLAQTAGAQLNENDSAVLSFNGQTDWVTLRFESRGSDVVAVAGRDRNGRARLAFASVENKKLVVSEFDLPEDTVAIDVGALSANSDALFVLTSSGVMRMTAIDAALQPIVAIDSIYRGRTYSALTSDIDFARDIDDDNTAELIIPGFDALSVFDGDNYAAAGTPALPSVRRSYENAVNYRPARFAAATALASQGILAMRGNNLHRFAATPDGYANQPSVQALSLGLASERDIEVFYNGDDDIDQSDLMLREAEMLEDINNDGLPDLVTLETRSSGVFDKTSTYRVHLAKQRNGDIVFSPEADTTLTSNGYQFYFDVIALDERHNALVSPSVKIGIRSIIGALFSKSVTLRISIHAPDANGVIPDEPNTEVKAKISFDFGSGQVETPTITFGDVNGDGRNDLILKSKGGVLAWRQNLGDGRFASKDARLDIAGPANGDNVGVADLDGDGKDDLIARYSKADGDDRRGAITWLRAF